MFITLNYKSRKPICDQLCDSIIQLVACGAMEPGEQLPSVRSLASELGINPNTVQKSYRTLEHDGVIESVPGKGSFVARQSNARNQLRGSGKKLLEEALQAALDRGLTPSELLTICEAYLSKKEGVTHD